MNDFGQPFLTLAALRKALSPERLGAYAIPGDSDETDFVARYLWNGALATVMVPTLHALEVTLRNNLFNASLKVVDEGSIAFPFLPKDHRNRPAIPQRLDELRELRNRTFHHEPIWDRNLPRSHQRAIDTLSWMNQGLGKAIKHLSRLDSVYKAGPGAFRNEAKRIVRP